MSSKNNKFTNRKQIKYKFALYLNNKYNEITFVKIYKQWARMGVWKIQFFDLTLLVGVSGVGKTQVLKSIYTLKEIACGESINGVKWELEFQTQKGNKYLWSGEFENIKSKNELFSEFFVERNEKTKPKIISERLRLNDKIIVERGIDKFQFNNNEMPKLISTESSINILNIEKENY